MYDFRLLGDETVPHARLRLRGELDYARKSELAALLQPLVAANSAILDVRGVRFLDTSALSCLIALRRQMLAAHGTARIILVGLRPELRRVFEVSDLTGAFELRDGTDLRPVSERGPAPSGD